MSSKISIINMRRRKNLKILKNKNNRKNLQSRECNIRKSSRQSFVSSMSLGQTLAHM